jgi:GT2 family glycosyltransferase
MQKYDFIGIATQSINGIKNPLLTLRGTINKKNYQFIVKADNKEIEFTITYNGDDFILNAPFSKEVKKIEVYVKTEENTYLIFSQKNCLYRRLKNRIVNTIRRSLVVIKAIFITLVKGIKFFWKEYHFLVPIRLWKKYARDFVDRVKQRSVKTFYDPLDVNDYNKWLEENKSVVEYNELKYRPLISVLIPVYNIGEKYLSECLDSVLNQSYDNFEICIVDDCSTNVKTINTLKKYETIDKRIKIKYRKENGHISTATNDALSMAKGEFIALVDNDDILDKDALYEVVNVLNKDKYDFIYTDEDKINLYGKRCEPNFKPDFSPDTLLSLNYICHLSVIRKKLVEEVGGFEIGLEGAQDHDLFLKISEKTDKIYHISKILYHWRMAKSSTAMTISNKSYATDKSKIAIENALKRRNIKGHVEKDSISLWYRVVYEYDKEPLVSIIIPTKDYAETTETCLKSVYEKTEYKNFEVLLVNNNSEEKETFELFDKYKKEHDNFKVIDANFEFNYSKINNLAIEQAKGEYIVLLNNDTEIITPNWLNIMVGYAMQPHIGAVGAKLLYPDETVQHAGVILGLGGVAGHAYIGSKREDCGIYGRLRVPYDYGAVTAACLVVSKKKFLEVGGLEEELKVAYNDVDFNIKLLKAGYYNVCTPQVEAFHFESKSRGLDTTTEKYQRFLQESNYMHEKWEKELANDRFYNSNFTKKIWFMLGKK